MYSGTKKWGTVRVTSKRLYPEVHKYKKSQSKERLAHRKALSEDKSQTFDVVVKA